MPVYIHKQSFKTRSAKAKLFKRLNDKKNNSRNREAEQAGQNREILTWSYDHNGPKK